MTLGPPDEREQVSNDPLWQRFERSVRELLAALDPVSTVAHNQKVPGRLSQVARQVDVWAVGSVVGVEISIAVECKRHQRRVNVETVDQFVGKLLDIGADRGIIYSYSGFTDSAVTRAWSARNPGVMVVAVDTPQVVHMLRGVPGYPADLIVQDVAPQWIEELSVYDFAAWLETQEWPKWFT
jgi:hypothetical protein